MELSSLGFDPGFRGVNDLPAVLGVGAVIFPDARITRVGGCPIPHDLAHWITIVGMQMLAARAFPHIQVAVIFEASRAELSRTPMRVTAEPLQSSRYDYEEDRICGSQHDLNVQRPDHGSRSAISPMSVNSAASAFFSEIGGTM